MAHTLVERICGLSTPEEPWTDICALETSFLLAKRSRRAGERRNIPITMDYSSSNSRRVLNKGKLAFDSSLELCHFG